MSAIGGFIAGILSYLVKDLVKWVVSSIQSALQRRLKKKEDEDAIDKLAKEIKDADTKEERDKAADDLIHHGF